MATYKTAGLGTYTLAGSISSTATSITLSSFKVPITETNVTMSSLGTTTAYGTLSPGTNDAEFISFTGITQNANGTATLTGVTRGLNKETPYTTSSSFKRPHTGQAFFILSNSPNVYDQYTTKVNDETITGTWTFPNDSTTPKLGSSYVAPTTQTQIASKGYVDSVAIAGAPDATTSVKGIVELATQAEYDARTATGGTGALLVPTPNVIRNVLTSDYVADTGTATAYAIAPTPAVTAYSNGQIFTFKAGNANTGTATLNVNSLGAKSIFLPGGTVPLRPNDILANQVVQVQYLSSPDGFQMLNYQYTPSGVIQMYGGASAPTGWLNCDGSAVSRTTYAALFAVLSTTYGTGDGSTTFNLPNFTGRVAVGQGTGTKVATFSSRSSNVITVTGLSNISINEFQTGAPVLYSTSGSTITGLTNNTTYYVIRSTNSSFSLATSLANANAGTAIALSSDGSGTQTFTYSITALTIGNTGGEDKHLLNTTEMPAHTHVQAGGYGVSNGTGPNINGDRVRSDAPNTGSTGGDTQHNNMQPFLTVNYIVKI